MKSVAELWQEDYDRLSQKMDEIVTRLVRVEQELFKMKDAEARAENAEASNKRWADNYQNAWAGLRMIREAVENLGPCASLISEEGVLATKGPEPIHEAEAIVEAITRYAEKAEAQRDELQAIFDLQWKADQRAIHRWQGDDPSRALTWPDRTDLTMWLLEKLETVERERDEANKCIEVLRAQQEPHIRYPHRRLENEIRARGKDET